MKRKIYVLLASVLALLLSVPATRAETGTVSRPVTLAGLQQQGTPEVPAQLQVQTGKSLVINSQETLQRVSVTDPAIATALIVAPTQVLIHGLTPGTVTLVLWDDQGRTRSFNLTVELDINSLTQTLTEVFPGENIHLVESGPAVILSGTVSRKDVGDQIAAVAASQVKNVVNLLQTEDGRQVVMLQVKFAEVDRTAVQQLGANLFSTGAANTPAAISTQQFGGLSGNVGGIPAGTTGGGSATGQNRVSGGIGNPLIGTPATFGLSDLLNLFVFRPDLNLGMAIRALEQKNLLQILAEPNVLALNGTEASFLAGGEFPFPVVQGTGGLNSVTVQFKEFGVRLTFTPTVLSDGAIRLKVAPEVSALDFANSVTVSGFNVPALSSRRAQTNVELRDGQSFAIAGLLDNRLTQVYSKIPVLGDLPILGNFFKSRNTNRSKTELMVMVTPHLVRPVEQTALPSGPEYPKPFLDEKQFDGKTGETPAR